jgi:hypothetical protein
VFEKGLKVLFPLIELDLFNFTNFYRFENLPYKIDEFLDSSDQLKYLKKLFFRLKSSIQNHEVVLVDSLVRMKLFHIELVDDCLESFC